eukprot:scaffold15609_cov55-Attheya_sp.AAC.2
MSEIASSTTEDLAKELTTEDDVKENSCKKRKLDEKADATSTVSSPAKKEADASSDDEVQIVDRPASWIVTPEKPREKSSGLYDADTEDEEDDVKVVGTVNALQLPHMRCHCTTAPFCEIGILSTAQKEMNANACDLCYCYVCDVPVKECLDWKSSHCNATDRGEASFNWRFQRTRQRNIRSAPEGVSFEAILPNARPFFKEVLAVLNHAGFKDVTLRCDAQGIRFMEMEGDFYSTASYRLNRDAFREYKCSQSLFMTIRLKDLLSSLRQVTKKSDSIVFLVRADDDILKITKKDAQSGELSAPHEVDFNRLVDDEFLLTMPICSGKSYASLPALLFKQTITTLTQVADYTHNCSISWGSRDEKPVLSFSAEGSEVLRANFHFMSNYSSGKDSIDVVVDEEFTNSFRLSQLFNFARFLGTQQVILSGCTENKLALKHKFLDNMGNPCGELMFYLPQTNEPY